MRTYLEILRHPALRLIFVVGFLLRIPVAGAGVLLTLHVVTRLHHGYAEAGMLSACATVAAAVAGPWRGRMLDRVGLRRTLLPSLILVPALWSVAPFVGYWALLVLSVVAGLFTIPIFSLVRQAIVAVCPDRLRRTALSLDSVIVELSFMIGPALGVVLATAWGTIPALLLFYVGGSLLCIVMFVLNPPLRAPADDDAAPGGDHRWITRGVVALLALMAAAMVVLAACDVAIVAGLRALGRSASIAWVLPLWSAGSAVGGIVYGALKRSIHPAWLLAGMSALTAPVALVTQDWLMALLLCASGLCCAPLIAATVDGLSRVVPAQRFGEAMGWHGSMGTVGGAIGAPLAGVLIDHLGWPWAFAFAGLFGLGFALVGGAAVSWRRRRA